MNFLYILGSIDSSAVIFAEEKPKKRDKKYGRRDSDYNYGVVPEQLLHKVPLIETSKLKDGEPSEKKSSLVESSSFANQYFVPKNKKSTRKQNIQPKKYRSNLGLKAMTQNNIFSFNGSKPRGHKSQENSRLSNPNKSLSKPMLGY